MYSSGSWSAKADVLTDTDTFFGGWQKLGARLEAIEAVTGEEVKRVMAKYLTKRNRTVVTLEVEK